MLEANGFAPVVVSGTSAGSVVGALYASGMDAFQMQEKAVALDQTSIRDVRLFSGGLVQGQKLQDYVNEQLGGKPIDKLRKPFAAVATRLEDGERTVFVRGNAGQAVRASSSIPGVFEPVTIGQYHYVDGGVVSPVPVDAARQLGAEFVVAVDISSKASGKNPGDLLGTVNQSISIMGQRLGEAELKRCRRGDPPQGQRHRLGRFQPARRRNPGRRTRGNGGDAADPRQDQRNCRRSAAAPPAVRPNRPRRQSRRRTSAAWKNARAGRSCAARMRNAWRPDARVGADVDAREPYVAGRSTKYAQG